MAAAGVRFAGAGPVGGGCPADGASRYTAGMKKSPIMFAASAALSVALLAGCGNKGSLVRPSDIPPAPVPAAEPATLPDLTPPAEPPVTDTVAPAPASDATGTDPAGDATLPPAQDDGD